MTEPHVRWTSPAKEISNLDHRRRVLERALAAEPHGTRATMNRAELQHLEEQHAAWSEEWDRNRQLWLAHHERLFRQHRELARRHYVAMLQLREEVITIAGDTPSPNGKH